ncbi:cytochrome aa3 quinol oxidase subunit II [Ammoniphilus resinae]|uniref:Quinol oxidase subunit 2 n=1 Tax=Ammoniphilus resinae TaxID=861532 RepID=A0ABS4GS61_9BACL|nr:cytochrome aa3 quinol oxidase subunit II [Ammoniphilus resinae]MBP1933123.1 cytochrome aa3-600 menaquinol oxidase subunit 2 [Ammoniphilus resinae]
MKWNWAILSSIFTIITVLTGCNNKLMVLDPKGPQAQTQADVIMISIWTMSIIVAAVFILLVIMLVKYRASKQPADYEPPHIEGSKLVESICIGIPVIIVIFLSVITIQSNEQVETTPKGYEGQKPLVVYASSSDWKWHFSYPEENIETVNYLYIPTDRPLEFKLYSYGPITSFWIPQLGGQKYAMSDMVNTLHLAADVPGEYMGRNANFSGKGFAENTFDVKAMPQDEFEKWVEEVKATAKPLTQEKFDELLDPGHLGRLTYTGTHLDFSPAPEGENGEHHMMPSHTEHSAMAE